jgi:hypothetical protein
VEGPEQVDPHDLLEAGGRVDRAVGPEGPFRPADAGAVDHHAQRPVVPGAIDGGLHGVLVPDVGGDEGAAGGGGDLGSPLGVAIGDHDGGTPSGQVAGRRLTETGGAAHDQRNLPRYLHRW